MSRTSAANVARWLTSKDRRAEAVAVLSAWSVQGPSDREAEDLLAEAFRLEPTSAVAKAAFERMEGVESEDPAPLDLAIATWTPAALSDIERQIVKPGFVRVQVGYNNNVKYKGTVYHIQTEDSGVTKPHIITHLFVDGGRIIKSHKRVYASELAREDLATYVRALMKAQHMEMAIMLREGRFEDVVAQRAAGGMEVLEGPPRTELVKPGSKRPQAASEKPKPDVVEGPVRFRLHVLRSLGGGPAVMEVTRDVAVIGRATDIDLSTDRFCQSREAELRWHEGRVWMTPLEPRGGVFVRIRQPVELDFGDEFLVGDQLLRLERNPDPNDGPGSGPTFFYSSPKWPSSFRVEQRFAGGAKGACVVARGQTLQIGSAIGDFVFTADPLVHEQHCLLSEQAGAVMLTDLGSRTGVFVRLKGEQEVVAGDELVIGRTRLLLEVL